MAKLIGLHALAAAITTAAYTVMTGGEASYIMAMMAMYLWVLIALISVGIWMKERKNPGKR